MESQELKELSFCIALIKNKSQNFQKNAKSLELFSLNLTKNKFSPKIGPRQFLTSIVP